MNLPSEICPVVSWKAVGSSTTTNSLPRGSEGPDESSSRNVRYPFPVYVSALQVVGADRLLFSVDYPFSPNALRRAFLDALPASPEEMAKITHGHAERLLRL